MKKNLCLLACFFIVQILGTWGHAANVVDHELPRIALFSRVTQSIFFHSYFQGVQHEAARLGFSLELVPVGEDSATQRALIAGSDKKHYKAIIINDIVNTHLEDVAAELHAKGIVIVAFNTRIASPYVSQVLQDDEAIGRKLSQQALRDHVDGGYIKVFHVSGFMDMDNRYEYWKRTIGGSPQWHSVDIETPWEGNISAQVFQLARKNVKCTDAIYAPWQDLVFPIVQALKLEKPNLKKLPDIYGADISDESLRLFFQSGSGLAALAGTNPYVMGVASVQAFFSSLNKHSAPRNYIVEPTLITREMAVKNNLQHVSDVVRVIPEFLKYQQFSEDRFHK